MTLKLASISSRTLVAAGLLLGGAAAQAAAGYYVSKSQESAIKAGMTQSEVQAKIGAPAVRHQFGADPGPSWTYHLVHEQNIVFDVDFGTDGRVRSTSERTEIGR